MSWQAHAYNMLGQTARLQGEFRRASSLLWQALKLFRAAGQQGRNQALPTTIAHALAELPRPEPTWRITAAH